MNDLIRAMSEDLSIAPFQGEKSSDYLYRLCFSALAAQILSLASGKDHGNYGISKKAQTEKVLQLVDLYQECVGVDKGRFIAESDDCSAFFRKAYEETGYLTVDDTNNSVIARFGRTVKTSGGYLYFGFPAARSKMVGLGVYTDTSSVDADLFETLLRDTRSTSDFIKDMFNPLDFEERDIDKSDLEFFNPTLKKPPSSSWSKKIYSQFTLAKSLSTKIFYRVICADRNGTLLFADNPIDTEKGCLTAYDLRRVFIALKAYYREPAVAWINPLDHNHYEITLSVHLPMREFYFLLLSAWPKENAFDRKRFITRTEFLPTIENVLNNIGIRTIWRQDYV